MNDKFVRNYSYRKTYYTYLVYPIFIHILGQHVIKITTDRSVRNFVSKKMKMMDIFFVIRKQGILCAWKDGKILVQIAQSQVWTALLQFIVASPMFLIFSSTCTKIIKN